MLLNTIKVLCNIVKVLCNTIKVLCNTIKDCIYHIAGAYFQSASIIAGEKVETSIYSRQYNTIQGEFM